jgi:hypothetical protein
MNKTQQNNPMQLIVAAFQDEDGAERALNELKAAKKAHVIKIENAAVIRKDMKGKLHIKEIAERKAAGKRLPAVPRWSWRPAVPLSAAWLPNCMTLALTTRVWRQWADRSNPALLLLWLLSSTDGWANWHRH